VSYELFWHLNPRKLEPFIAEREMRVKEQMEMLNVLAWNIGLHNLLALGQMFGESHTAYPSEPQSVDSYNATSEPKGEVMTDGARFAAFAARHNRQIRERRKT